MKEILKGTFSIPVDSSFFCSYSRNVIMKSSSRVSRYFFGRILWKILDIPPKNHYEYYKESFWPWAKKDSR
jgi:hypothetical protein